MSSNDPDDLLVRALRELGAPSRDAEGDRRARELGRSARAAFLEEAGTTTLVARVGLLTARAAMPVVLASLVGVYLVWALSAAVATVH